MKKKRYGLEFRGNRNMRLVWELEPTSVQDILNSLPPDRSIAYALCRPC